MQRSGSPPTPPPEVHTAERPSPGIKIGFEESECLEKNTPFSLGCADILAAPRGEEIKVGPEVVDYRGIDAEIL